MGQVPLHSFETRNLRIIYYDNRHAYILNHMARCFENSLKFHRELFDYTPSEPVTVLLQDFNDYGSAGTNTIPWNFLNVNIEPYDYVYETSPTNERINWVMNHELVHILATDKAAASDRFYRTLFFGKVAPDAVNPLSMFYSFLTTPRWYSPRWYHEGIAVFMETWMAGGIGRAQNGYDEMVFRAMVNDSARFYDVVGLESEGTTIDFQVGVNSYLYGTRFVSYLAYHYGLDKMLLWFNRCRGSKRYFSRQFKKLYGTSLKEEWDRWIEWERVWQTDNLRRIRRHPVTPARPLCDKVLGSVSRAYHDPERGKLYVGINYPGQTAQIASIDMKSGKIRKLCDMPTPALYYVCSLAYDPENGKLFYTTHNSTQWRNLNEVDVETGKTRVLIKRLRTGDLVFNRRDRSLWGMRHQDGFSSLVRIPHPYSGYQEVMRLPYGRDLFDIDISADGKRLSGSLVEIDGTQRLVLFETEKLLRRDFTYDILEEFENNSPQNFVFTPDGKKLIGTSYYSNVSNVFSHDIESGRTEIITNSENGFFRPVFVSADSLIVFRYSGKGFLPVMIPVETCQVRSVNLLGYELVEKHPRLKEWKLQPPSPKRIDLDTLKVKAGPYHSLSNLRLASLYPVVEGYKDFPSYGIRMNLMDPLGGIDAFNMNLTYTPHSSLDKDERFHMNFEYQHWNLKINGWYNGTDFYDLFGPTKTSRKGYSLGLEYSNFLVYDKPRRLEYILNAAGYGGLEKLPDYQNVNASYDRLFTAGAGLRYSREFRSLGAVESEKGTAWSLFGTANWVNRVLYPRVYGSLDAGFLLPLHHSSIWFRLSSGLSWGDREEPFANFYFGGFGNNRVDYRSAQRYRSYYSFPGLELNEAGGTTFGKILVEWTLPPLRFRRFGVPAFYFRWARLALFASGLVTNYDSSDHRQNVTSIGAQLDIRLVTLSIYNSTLSLGAARAFSENGLSGDEFMISMKIM